jgi:SAM-dependent methyltransferase
VWTGRGFRLGGKTLPILSYEVGASGWTDDLTAFHEGNAGGDHFIDRASRAHALREVRRHARGPSPVVLEVGCSSGFLLEELRRALPHAQVIGSDYVRGPLERLAGRLPNVPLLQFDLVKCPLPDDSIDVAVLLNVLEHIEDDAGAVRQLRRIVKPGGTVVLEVPAGPHLYDVYDKVLMHYRRYRLSGLRRLLTDGGFTVEHASSLGALLYPGFWWVKRRNRRYLDAPEDLQKQVVARAIRKSGRKRLFEALMWVESCLRRVVPLPFGIRCLATCVKPATRCLLPALAA